MNATKQMSPVGHVAVLAGFPLPGIRAVEPFSVGVLQWFSVHCRICIELVAGGAKQAVAQQGFGFHGLMNPGTGFDRGD